MKRSIPEHLLSGLPDTTNAKEFFNAVEKLYDTGENAEAGHLMDEMTTIKYDELKGVRDFILKLVNVQSKLKDHNIPLPDSFIIHRALHALPASFSLIKTAYNTYNQTWTISDLISQCVAEESKLKREKNESANYVSHLKPNKGKGKFKNKNDGATKENGNGKEHKNKQKNNNGKSKYSNVKCYFCEKLGHRRTDCHKFKTWLEKKQAQSGAKGSQEAK
ncbi:hypothetical protein CsatA_004500 [Cannabis sativa]